MMVCGGYPDARDLIEQGHRLRERGDLFIDPGPHRVDVGGIATDEATTQDLLADITTIEHADGTTKKMTADRFGGIKLISAVIGVQILGIAGAAVVEHFGWLLIAAFLIQARANRLRGRSQSGRTIFSPEGPPRRGDPD